MIGTFGDIVFEVSQDKILTFSDLNRRASVRFGEHNIIGQKPVLQLAGSNLDEISFKMKLNRGLGVDPLAEIGRLRSKMLAGDESNLIFANKIIGKFVVSELAEAWNYLIGGIVQVIAVDLTLREYN